MIFGKRKYRKKYVRQPYLLSHFDRELLSKVKLYAIARRWRIWAAIQHLTARGLQYEGEHPESISADPLLYNVHIILHGSSKELEEQERPNGVSNTR